MWNLVLNIFLSFVLTQTNTGAAFNNDVQIVKLNPIAPKLDIIADKAVVLASNDRLVFFEKNPDEVQPIASITKLMTALVFLENNPGWESTYEITEADQVEGGLLNLAPGDEVKIKDLFNTSLIASDNGATLALVHATKLDEKSFVEKMNAKALVLDLAKTKFSDAVGLSDQNVSTAREVALLAKVALAEPEISQATESKTYQFETINGKDKKIESTDYLLFDLEKNIFQVKGGKTGYTDKAGYCFVGRFKDETGREIISVVLNSSGKNERFKETKSIVNWVFQNYEWRP